MKVRVTKQTRRGTRAWVVDWTDRDDKRHQPRFPTREAAEAEADRLRTTLKAQHGKTPALPADTTWTGLFERLMTDRGDLKPRTLESYRELHVRHLAPAFGATPVREITRLRLKDFLRAQLTRYSRNTVRLMHATLHVVLEEATEDGLVSANPAAGLARKLKLTAKVKARQAATKVKAMTREERDRFLTVAERVEPWWAPMWAVQTLTGLRPGEVYALEEPDLDLAGETLHVARALSDDGQGVDTPKGGITRDVDLSHEAVRLLRAHLIHRREATLRHGWGDLPRALFCSTGGTHPDPSGVRKAFRRVCRAAALTHEITTRTGQQRTVPRFTPHGLRHTYAALHLQAGTDVYYVSRMLGHADIALTVHTYGAWLKPDRRPAVNALDRAAPEPQERRA